MPMTPMVMIVIAVAVIIGSVIRVSWTDVDAHCFRFVGGQSNQPKHGQT